MYSYLPKGFQGWCKAAGEISIIVVGVIIALFLEQIVKKGVGEHFRLKRAERKTQQKGSEGMTLPNPAVSFSTKARNASGAQEMDATNRLAKSSTPIAVTLALATAIAGCTSAPPPRGAVAPAEPVTAGAPNGLAAQRAFFENLRALCGQTFGGRTILAPVADRTFEPARLYMVVKDCVGDEIRIPFIVGEDASRTWVFQMRKDGLKFFHEHLRPDGTAHEPSGFGGHATEDGSPVFQSFPDSRATANTPLAERPIWRLRLDTEHELFVYYLDRGSLPGYRLAFHMGPASPPLKQ